jgi:hypothetical protein
LVEIISGKGSGALKKHAPRFLDQKEIKALYHRVEEDSNDLLDGGLRPGRCSVCS